MAGGCPATDADVCGPLNDLRLLLKECLDPLHLCVASCECFRKCVQKRAKGSLCSCVWLWKGG